MYWGFYEKFASQNAVFLTRQQGLYLHGMPDFFTQNRPTLLGEIKKTLNSLENYFFVSVGQGGLKNVAFLFCAILSDY